MSSEVYAVKISVDSGSSSATTSDEHFGAVVCVFADNNIDGARTLSSITDSNGLDILGNATLGAISASTGTANTSRPNLVALLCRHNHCDYHRLSRNFRKP